MKTTVVLRLRDEAIGTVEVPAWSLAACPGLVFNRRISPFGPNDPDAGYTITHTSSGLGLFDVDTMAEGWAALRKFAACDLDWAVDADGITDAHRLKARHVRRAIIEGGRS